MPASVPPFNILVDEQVADRHRRLPRHRDELRTGIADDSSMVGRVVTDPGSMVPVGQSKVYRLFAEKEGVFLSQSLGGPFGSEGSQGNSANGLFGQVIVNGSCAPDAALARQRLPAAGNAPVIRLPSTSTSPGKGSAHRTIEDHDVGEELGIHGGLRWGREVAQVMVESARRE